MEQKVEVTIVAQTNEKLWRYEYSVWDKTFEKSVIENGWDDYELNVLKHSSNGRLYLTSDDENYEKTFFGLVWDSLNEDYQAIIRASQQALHTFYGFCDFHRQYRQEHPDMFDNTEE